MLLIYSINLAIGKFDRHEYTIPANINCIHDWSIERV
jgi:hypothetical protein